MINYIRSFFLMKEAHEGKFDKAGKEKYLHPIAVAAAVESMEAKTVAILHDVLEDSKFTFEDFYYLTDEEQEALLLLTEDGDEDYFTYIAKIKSNDLAREVKIADLKQSIDKSNFPNPSPQDLETIREYKNAIEYLEK